MKIHYFNGTETTFEVETDALYIEVTYCDYTIHSDRVEIHSIDANGDLDINALEDAMYDCIDWYEVEQRAIDAWEDNEEMFRRGK
jgi:hypothetical protein